ncbi:MAG: hypothetical protein H7337_25100 [Rhizobacter sp.]|nr:hypothetical protein [Rhizobacter sp.]
MIQHRAEVTRCDVADVHALEKLLKLFFSFERAEIADFRRAAAQFKTDLPAVLEALRSMIEREHSTNPAFTRASKKFLKHAQEAINPGLTAADVREMLIQHILTEEIFSKVFDSEFHRDNSVARELYKLEATFRARFDTYRFADHKKKVIDLLMRVTTVSAETVWIVAAMKGAGR